MVIACTNRTWHHVYKQYLAVAMLNAELCRTCKKYVYAVWLVALTSPASLPSMLKKNSYLLGLPASC